MTMVEVINPYDRKPLKKVARDFVDEDGRRFPWHRGAYRFVDSEEYAANFGFQWNRFERTQIDRFRRGYDQSRDRFFAATDWSPSELKGKTILEVGSGAGRFTQVLLEHTEAELYSIDISNAVEANYRNNGPHARLHLFQASVYDLPFANHQFDKVFCFGVLQHTPDARRSVEKLALMVKPGGELVVDFYPMNGWYTKLHVKYLLRPFTKRMKPEKLLRRIEANVDRLMAAYRFAQGLRFGPLAKRLVPVCDVAGTLPRDLDRDSLREWVVLDTFDMFSPWHDHPQRISNVKRWFHDSGMCGIWGGSVRYGCDGRVTVVRGRRPKTESPSSESS